MATTGSPGGKPTAINRPLGGTEKIYWLLDKLYSLNFVAFAELDGELDPDKLQAALSSVQEATPLLRTRIVVRGQVPVFEAVDPRQYPLQVEALALRGWRRFLEGQLDSTFAPGQAPLARWFWFRGTSSRSIVALLFHHPIADGRSGLRLLLDVLRQATGGGAPFAYKKAHPSVGDLDLLRRQNVIQGKLKEVKFWLEKGREVLNFARQLPGYDMAPAAQRQTRSLALLIPKSTSTALLAACREQGTSVHGALGAAQVLALNDEFGSAKARVMALNSLADLRPVIEGKLTEEDLGLYVSTLTTVHKIDKNPDFWQLAREIRDQLQHVISSGDANLIHSFYPQNKFFTPDKRGAKMVQAIVALAPPSSMLTNIGRIEPVQAGPELKVRQLGFLLSPPAQYPICVTAASYKGRMFLNLLHDQSKLSAEQAGRIAASIVRHLGSAAD